MSGRYFSREDKNRGTAAYDAGSVAHFSSAAAG